MKVTIEIKRKHLVAAAVRLSQDITKEDFNMITDKAEDAKDDEVIEVKTGDVSVELYESFNELRFTIAMMAARQLIIDRDNQEREGAEREEAELKELKNYD